MSNLCPEWLNVAIYPQVIFGALAQLDKHGVVSSMARPVLSSQEQHNVLPLAACPQRFPLLPLSSKQSNRSALTTQPLPAQVISRVSPKLDSITNWIFNFMYCCIYIIILLQNSVLRLPWWANPWVVFATFRVVVTPPRPYQLAALVVGSPRYLPRITGP